MDIVVTTPKSQIKNAIREAAAADSSSFYFREFKSLPKNLQVGDRVYYVDDGWIRGFAIVDQIVFDLGGISCDVTGRTASSPGIFMRADSWQWITPIPCQGFQGFRYASSAVPAGVRITGGWRDPRPELRRDRGGRYTGEWCFYATEDECDEHQGCGFHT